MSAARLRIYLAAGAGGIGLLSAAASAVLVPAEHGVAVALVWVGLGILPAMAVAVWLVHRRPDHRQARRLLLMAAAWSVSVGLEGPTRTLYQHLGPGRWLLLADLAGAYASLLSAVVATVLVASYPDGAVERRWHRVLLRIVWAQLLVPPLALLTVRHVVVDPFLVPAGTPAIFNPFALPDLPWLRPTFQIAGSGVCGAALGVIVLLGRHVGAGASARPMRPLVYVVLSGLTIAAVDVVLALLGVPRTSLSRMVLSFAVLVVLMLIPVTVVWGVLRWRLFDIEPVVRRSVVLGVLSLGIASVYAALAAAPGLALGNAVPVQVAVIVSIAAALAFQPARRRLDLLADRLVFGRRVNRYQIVSSFGASLERTVDLSDLLPRLAEAVQAGLGARWVLVSLQAHDGVRLEAPHGLAGERYGDAELVQTLRRGTEALGRIDCGPKVGGYDEADRQLLATLAAQSATAIANVRLTAELTERLDELSRSRARIVAAQDAERRRIERNIHDGVQQHAVALITNLRLTRNLFARGQLLEVNLAHLQRDAHELLIDLRELALGIHRPGSQ
ncbi:MAG TPA: histidine kinase dimerization/phosphoacceptor domain-containing protein [Micromonosporaceae bacterium]